MSKSHQKETTKFKPFAWYDISLRIPEDWELTVKDGKPKKGYVRLDDEEQVRLEIRWENIGKKKFSLERSYDNLIKDLVKQSKQKKQPLNILGEINLKKGRKRSSGKEVKYFAWESSTRVYCSLSFCSQCRRVVYMQFFSSPHKKEETLAGMVLKSLEDHPVAGLSEWAVYDFRFRIPEDYLPVIQKLEAGRLYFCFEKKKGEVVEIERWSAASLLAEKYGGAEKWLWKRNASNYPGLDISRDKDIYSKHPTWHLVAKRRKGKGIFGAGSRPGVDGYFWHCPLENKFCTLIISGKVSLDAKKYAQNVFCCQPLSDRESGK